MEPADDEVRESLKRMRKWNDGQTLTHSTITDTTSEKHKHAILFDAWIDPRYATTGSMNSCKLKRSAKLSKIFHSPENQEWVDERIQSVTTEAFLEVESAVLSNISVDVVQSLRRARHVPVALALTQKLWTELQSKRKWCERPYFTVLLMNTVLDAVLRLLRSEGLLTIEESIWFQSLFEWNNDDLHNNCILLTDGGGNARIEDILAIINRMHLVRKLHKGKPR